MNSAIHGQWNARLTVTVHQHSITSIQLVPTYTPLLQLLVCEELAQSSYARLDGLQLNPQPCDSKLNITTGTAGNTARLGLLALCNTK